MAYMNSQPLGVSPQPIQGGGGWKALQFMDWLNAQKKPLTKDQVQAFNQGAGPVSRGYAPTALANTFQAQVFDNYGSAFAGYPSMNEVLQRATRGY